MYSYKSELHFAGAWACAWAGADRGELTALAADGV